VNVEARRSEQALTVLLVVSSEDDGGAARSSLLLARDLAACGVQARMVVQRETALTARLAKIGLPYDIVPGLFVHPARRRDGVQTWSALAPNLAAMPATIAALRSLALKHGASILYGQGTWANCLAAVAARRAGLAVVWHIRNDHSSRPVRCFVRTVARLTPVKAVIAVSSSAAGPYENLPIRTEVIHNGVDLALVDIARQSPLLRTRLGIGRDVVLGGYAGRLVDHKGLDILFAAAAAVLPRVPRLQLVWLGGNPAHLGRDVVSDWRTRIEAAGLGGRILLTGHVQDVERHIADLDFLVVPSTFADPCPRVVVEGLALGIPVVASRIGGIPEIVRDGVDGLLVSPGSAAELAEALFEMSTNPTRRRVMADEARLGARRFDSRQVAARVASLLRAR
jgi:glycosyltransferase involved in cell wall biosynthesis